MLTLILSAGQKFATEACTNCYKKEVNILVLVLLFWDFDLVFPLFFMFFISFGPDYC